MHLPRVVITGYGCLTPIGRNVSENFASLLAKKSNFRRFRDVPGLPKSEHLPSDQFVSLIEISQAELAQNWDKFNPTRSNAFLNITLKEALDQAKIDPKAIAKNPERVGISIGALSSNLAFLDDAISNAVSTKYASLHRLTMMNVLNNILATSVSVRLGAKGPMLTPSTACATGLSAIGEAMNAIRLGYADMFVCGAAEEGTNPVSGWGPIRLGALNRDPKNGKICAPFDRDRNGIILGEAGAVVVVETLESAMQRGVDVLAEVVDFGMSSDGHHYVKPEPTGEGGYQAMKSACRTILNFLDVKSGDFCTDNVVINAHATGTAVGDAAELQAIGRFATLVSGTHPLLVTANKGNFGHCFSAAGTVETIMGVEGLRQGMAPPINYFEATENGQMPPGVTLATHPIACPNRTFLLKSSFGFGGVNCAILIRRWT